MEEKIQIDGKLVNVEHYTIDEIEKYGFDVLGPEEDLSKQSFLKKKFFRFKEIFERPEEAQAEKELTILKREHNELRSLQNNIETTLQKQEEYFDLLQDPERFANTWKFANTSEYKVSTEIFANEQSEKDQETSGSSGTKTTKDKNGKSGATKGKKSSSTTSEKSSEEKASETPAVEEEEEKREITHEEEETKRLVSMCWSILWRIRFITTASKSDLNKFAQTLKDLDKIKALNETLAAKIKTEILKKSSLEKESKSKTEYIAGLRTRNAQLKEDLRALEKEVEKQSKASAKERVKQANRLVRKIREEIKHLQEELRSIAGEIKRVHKNKGASGKKKMEIVLTPEEEEEALKNVEELKRKIRKFQKSLGKHRRRWEKAKREGRAGMSASMGVSQRNDSNNGRGGRRRGRSGRALTARERMYQGTKTKSLMKTINFGGNLALGLGTFGSSNASSMGGLGGPGSGPIGFRATQFGNDNSSDNGGGLFVGIRGFGQYEAKLKQLQKNQYPQQRQQQEHGWNTNIQFEGSNALYQSALANLDKQVEAGVRRRQRLSLRQSYVENMRTHKQVKVQMFGSTDIDGPQRAWVKGKQEQKQAEYLTPRERRHRHLQKLEQERNMELNLRRERRRTGTNTLGVQQLNSDASDRNSRRISLASTGQGNRRNLQQQQKYHQTNNRRGQQSMKVFNMNNVLSPSVSEQKRFQQQSTIYTRTGNNDNGIKVLASGSVKNSEKQKYLSELGRNTMQRMSQMIEEQSKIRQIQQQTQSRVKGSLQQQQIRDGGTPNQLNPTTTGSSTLSNQRYLPQPPEGITSATHSQGFVSPRRRKSAVNFISTNSPSPGINSNLTSSLGTQQHRQRRPSVNIIHNPRRRASMSMGNTLSADVRRSKVMNNNKMGGGASGTGPTVQDTNNHVNRGWSDKIQLSPKTSRASITDRIGGGTRESITLMMNPRTRGAAGERRGTRISKTYAMPSQKEGGSGFALSGKVKLQLSVDRMYNSDQPLLGQHRNSKHLSSVISSSATPRNRESSYTAQQFRDVPRAKDVSFSTPRGTASTSLQQNQLLQMIRQHKPANTNLNSPKKSPSSSSSTIHNLKTGTGKATSMSRRARAQLPVALRNLH
eukprot:g2368.t1